MDVNHMLSAVDRAYVQLRRKILQKEYGPGERLSESELAKQVGFSRTPVREALRRLAADGFLVIMPNQGVWVASPTVEGMAQAYEVREMLECQAIEKAARRVTPLLIAQLEAKIAEEESIIQNRDLDRYWEVNSDFHTLLAMGSGNEVLVDFVKRVLWTTAVYMVFFEPLFHFDSLKEHRVIVEALKNGRVDESVDALRRHIRVRIAEVRQRELAPLLSRRPESDRTGPPR